MEQNTAQNPRRRFFKLAALSTAFAGLAGAGFGALAHGRRGGRGPIDPAQMEQRLDRMLKHAYVEIDATEAQKQKIDPIVKQAAQELQPLRAKVREARREGIKLFSAESIDRGAFERLRVEQMASADAASKRFTQALSDVAEVLTPEQRKTLAARFARRGRERG
ncbi:MAG: periplasmic heavy metal sensor [Burkholderiales bacterium]